MTTILNKKYILSYLEKNNYYDKVYHDSLSTLEGYTIQVGLTSEEVEKILPKEKVEVDIKNFIDCIYKNQELKIDATILTDNLEGLIQEKLKENHRDATEEEVVAINNLKKQVADSYEDKIIYSKKYALKLRDSYHKFSCYQNKILFLLFSLEFFLLALLGLITKTFEDGTSIRIYNMERTICDIIRDRNKIDSQIFNTALKEYMKRNDKNLNLLYIYAKKFRILKILKIYLDVLG